MHDDAMKTERAPEIPNKIDILLKMIIEHGELIERLDSRVLSIMTDGGDQPALDRPPVSSQTALGEKLAQCDEKLRDCNLHLAEILDRLEV